MTLSAATSTLKPIAAVKLAARKLAKAITGNSSGIQYMSRNRQHTEKPMTVFAATRSLKSTIVVGVSAALLAPIALADQPSIVVIGIDRTAGWEEMTSTALRVAESTFETLKQGDSIEVRLISDASWSNSNHLGSVSLPAADIPRRTSLQENPQVTVQRNQLIRQFRQRRAAAAKRLRAIIWSPACIGPTSTTDIGGFLQASAERFAAHPAELHRRLIIISDFEERQFYEIDATLTGVEVTLYPLREDPNPSVAQGRLTKWSDWLGEQTGVTNVTVRRPVELPPPRKACD